MKKIVSLVLAVMMLISVVPTVSAYVEGPNQCAGGDMFCAICGKCPTCDGPCDCYGECDYTNGTAVKYAGTGTEAYTVTVPAELAPGASGTVTLEGTWASNRAVTVTADANVVLTNSINAQDTKTLDVTFNTIELAGDNNVAVSDTEAVSVADIEDALFGTWSGRFNYNVEIGNVA